MLEADPGFGVKGMRSSGAVIQTKKQRGEAISKSVWLCRWVRRLLDPPTDNGGGGRQTRSHFVTDKTQ